MVFLLGTSVIVQLAKTLCSQMLGAQVPSLVRLLRSHMPQLKSGAAKKKKNKAHRASSLRGRRPFGGPVFLPTDLQTHAWKQEVEVLHPGSSVPALLLGPSHFSEGRTPGPPFPPCTPQVLKSTEAWSHHLPSGLQVFII